MPGLSAAWRAGGVLYSGLGRLDARRGVGSLDEALAWLADESLARGRPIGEVQFWGHGRWGCGFVGAEQLGIEALDRTHPLHAGLARVRDRIAPGGDALCRATAILTPCRQQK